MLKPSSPAATVPGMTDTLDFVKNLWGSMSIPGANMSAIPGMSTMSGLASPALSPDELEKRIADLKAVESWLNMNLTMLRGTIQGMEVQRSTLVTLKTMGASMAEAMRQSGVSADKMAAMPFASFFGQSAAAAPSAPSAPSAAATPASKPQAASGSGSAQSDAAAPQGNASHAGTDAASAAAMGMPAAMAWWNLLQEQFTQAVTTAMTPAAAAGATASGTSASAAGAKTTPPPQAPAGGATPETGGIDGNSGLAGGNGKGRGGRPKADKA